MVTRRARSSRSTWFAVAAMVATRLPDAVRAGLADYGDTVLVFGALLAGDAVNVIPSHAELRGTFRTPAIEAWARAEAVVRDESAAMLAGTGATWKLDYRRGIPPVVNTPDETRVLAAAARQAVRETGVGAARVVEAPQSLGGDSFAWYLEEVSGSYARLGVHDPARSAQLDLHSSVFDVDERAIDIGVRCLVHTALAASPMTQPEQAERFVAGRDRRAHG